MSSFSIHTPTAGRTVLARLGECLGAVLPIASGLVVALFLLGLLGGAAEAASASNGEDREITDGAPTRSVTLGWTDTPPVLDGVMDDRAWLEGGLVDDMLQVIPVSGATPSQRTEIRVVTDGHTLYVGFRCYDSDPERIIHNRKKRDNFPFYDDRIGLSIDTFHTRRNGYFFATNPNGMRHDVLLESENFEISWDTIWFVETSIDDEGWTAEIAIPFSSISFDPDIDTWGINFERGIRRNDEDIRWSDQAPQRFVSSMGVAGVLTGVRGLDQGLGFEITPGVTVRRIDDKGTDDRFEADPTFDAFYKILPSVSAAVTANTDFGQVEVDDIQIQNDRFALFFPEKRDFFLEDGLIFDFGDISRNGRPFFSRRIGFNSGGPVGLLGGGKVTGRVGPVKFGALNTVVKQKNGVAAQNLFVGRAALNVLGESTVGAIVTNGTPNGGDNSTTVGADFLYRNSNFLGLDKTFRTTLWFAKVIEEEQRGSRSQGYGVKLEYPNDRNYWLLGFEELQKDYTPRLGFVNRNDIRHTFFSYRYRTRFQSGPWRTIDNEVFGQVFVDSENELQSVFLRFVPLEFTSPINDGFDFRYAFQHDIPKNAPDDPNFPNFDVPSGTYTFHEGAFRVFTSRNRPVRAEAQFGYGSYYDGTRARVEVDLEYRPSHYLFLEVEYRYQGINLPQAGSTLAGSPDRNDRDTQLLRMKIDFLFTPNVIWSNFIQYDNRSDSAGLNSRFRYILQDGREFFLVFNQGVDTSTNDLDRTRTETLVKGVWTFTF